MKWSHAIGLGIVVAIACTMAFQQQETVLADDSVSAASHAFVAAVAADDLEYEGSKSCKMCHIKVYKSWEESRHAKALESLMPGKFAESKTKAGLDPEKDYSKDAACLECHTVGYGKPGGYEVPDPDDRRAVREAERRAHVGCESCHGPASKYNDVFKDIKKNKRNYKLEELTSVGLIKPDEATCKSCHNDKSPTFDESKPFDFEEMSKEGVHEHEELELRQG